MSLGIPLNIGGKKMNTKLSNKYWKKAIEMEALTPKVSFYEYLMNNINNEEQERRKKAEEFYKKNNKKSLYNNSKLYIEYVRKAIELDGQNKNVEYDYKDVVSYIRTLKKYYYNNLLTNQKQHYECYLECSNRLGHHRSYSRRCAIRMLEEVCC